MNIEKFKATMTPSWSKGILRYTFLFLVGAKYFGYIDWSWDTFIRILWVNIAIGVCLQWIMVVLSLIIYLLRKIYAWAGGDPSDLDE